MTRILAILCAVFWMLGPVGAPIVHAQTAQPLSACNTSSYQANGVPMPLTQTTGGALCASVNQIGGVAPTIDTGSYNANTPIFVLGAYGSGAYNALNFAGASADLTGSRTLRVAGSGLYTAGGNTPASTGQYTPVAVDPAGVQLVGPKAPGTQESCDSGNVANSAAACTLATATGKTTYISAFTMSASGATAGLPVTCTLTGVITGTKHYTFTFPAGVLVPATPLHVDFAPPLQASATNTTIVASCPAGGSGATNATMTAEGGQE